MYIDMKMTSPLHTSQVRKLVRARKSVPARKLVRVWSLNSKVNTYLFTDFYGSVCIGALNAIMSEIQCQHQDCSDISVATPKRPELRAFNYATSICQIGYADTPGLGQCDRNLRVLQLVVAPAASSVSCGQIPCTELWNELCDVIVLLMFLDCNNMFWWYQCSVVYRRPLIWSCR